MARSQADAPPQINNLPAKHLHKVHRPAVHKDRSKYDRKTQKKGWETGPDRLAA